jgi:hypothetical protein
VELLDLFALVVLFVLVASGVGIWIVLGMMPGRIAHAREHPHADAIGVCGWWGVITMGLLLPVAYVWAYTNPRWREPNGGGAAESEQGEAR